MKKLLVSIFFIISVAVSAQIKSPMPSPSAKLIQDVGLTKVTLEYSRPAMRGRTIFGELVPFGKTWRTGANERTKITFNKSVTIGGNELKAGTYGIITIPNASQWDVIFYTDHGGYGAPEKVDESKVAARVNASVQRLPMTVQSFTMSIDDIKNGSAVLSIFWEKSFVSVPFEVNTDKEVMASIDKAISGPGTREYFLAARYYYSEGKDLKKAKEWIDMAIKLKENPTYWELRQQSLIYAANGKVKEAIKIAKKSMELAEKEGNDDYVSMNKKSLAEWMQ